MNQYQFGTASDTVVFTPNAIIKLKINGIEVHLAHLQSKLLKYMIDNSGEIIPINTIIDDVWGPGDHTQNAFSMVLSELNKKLPAECKIKNIPREGYIFPHKLITTNWRYERVEQRLINSPKFNQRIKLGLLLFALMTSAMVVMAGIKFYDSYYRQHFAVNNIEALFTWNYVVGTPKLSPDGRYIAYRISKATYKGDYLAIFDLKLKTTTPLVPMGFSDGFAWNLTGDKIVYQRSTQAGCEVKLLSFDDHKNIMANELLTKCAKLSGQLSFAWHSDNEFYANFVAEDRKTSLNGLPLHHLFSFNIGNKKEITRLATANYQGGVGFFSLNYDRTTKALYFLQSNQFKTTDFYQYKNGELTKLHTFDYELKYFTVDDNKLIFKNQHGHFVINAPATNYSHQQELLYPQPDKLQKPHLQNDKLVYLTGETLEFSLHRLTSGKATEIDTNNARATTLNAFNNELLFASAQTGIHQVYKVGTTNIISRITNKVTDERITYISSSNNIVAISYLNKVEIYRYVNNKLQKLKTLHNVTQGTLDLAGKNILLKASKHSGKNTIVERRLSDYSLTGRKIDKAKLAFYHQGQIVFLSHDYALMRLDGIHHRLITSDILTTSIEYTNVKGGDFYYIKTNKPYNKIIKINLLTGNKSEVSTANLNTSRIQWIGDTLYIQAYDKIGPKIIIGDLSEYY